MLIGRAIDGYLANCKVFIDLNGNSIADPDEPFTVTDKFGGFVLMAAAPGIIASIRIETSKGLGCVDTFTRQAPGMLSLVSAAVESKRGVTYGAAGVVTPLTTVSASLTSKYGIPLATSNLLVALAFGVPNGTDLANVDPIAALAAGGSADRGAMALMVATSLIANLVSNLATLLTFACGGSTAAAERFVLAAIAKRIVTAAGIINTARGRQRSMLQLQATTLSESTAKFAAASGSDPPMIDLGSTALVSELARESVAEAVEDGAMSSAGDVSISAIVAVAGVASSAARHLQSAALAASSNRTDETGNGDADPMAVVRAAAAMTAVMQGPRIRDAIGRASQPGGDSSGWSVLARLADADTLTAAVAIAQRSVVIELPPFPQSPGLPPPTPLPPPPKSSLVSPLPPSSHPLPPPSSLPASTVGLPIAEDVFVYIASGAAAVMMMFVVWCVAYCRNSHRRRRAMEATTEAQLLPEVEVEVQIETDVEVETVSAAVNAVQGHDESWWQCRIVTEEAHATNDNGDGHEDVNSDRSGDGDGARVTRNRSDEVASSATVERWNGVRSPPSLSASPASAPSASASPGTLHASLGSHSSSAELPLTSGPPHLWSAEALRAVSTSAARDPAFAPHVLHHVDDRDNADADAQIATVYV